MRSAPGPHAMYLSMRRLLRFALAALLGAMLAWVGTEPALRWWYFSRLDAPDAQTRRRALSIVARNALDKDKWRRDVERWVYPRLRTPTDPMHEPAVNLAVWLADRSAEFRASLTRRASEADDGLYGPLIAVLEHSRNWSPRDLPRDERIRFELFQAERTAPARMPRALAELRRFADGPAPRVEEFLAERLGDAHPAIRAAAVETLAAWAGPANSDRIAARAGDDSALVRVQVALVLGCLGEDRPELRPLSRDADADVRRAAVWAMGRCDATDPPCLTALAGDDDPAVRAQTAHTLGMGGASAEFGAILRQLAQDPDGRVRARAWTALGRRGEAVSVDLAESGLGAAEREVRLAAIRALPRVLGDPAIALAKLETRARAAIAKSDARELIACLEAMARLEPADDSPARTLMASAAAAELMPPLLRLQAARSLMHVGDERGPDALLTLFGAQDARIRTLAAFWLAKSGRARPEDLRRQLGSYDDRRKCAALLAFGWSRENVGEKARKLLGYATSPTVRVHVTLYDMMLGNAGAAERWGELLGIEELDDLALHAALLEAGVSESLELLLGEQGDVRYDLMGMLRTWRFIEVLAHYLPQAPTFNWFDDTELCQWQLARQRQWYRIHGARSAR